MLAHLLLAAVATLFAAEPAQDHGLGAYVLKHGTSRSVTSYYLLNKIYDEPGDFLWAHYDGVDYVVHDAATIEEFARIQASVPHHSDKKHELQRQLRAAERERERLHTRSVTASTESERRAAADALAPIEANVHSLERQIDAVDEELRNARNDAAAKLGRLVDSAVRSGLAVKVQQ
jgi:hypothetical protein